MPIIRKISVLFVFLIIAGCASIQKPKGVNDTQHSDHSHHHAPHDGISIPFYSKQGQTGEDASFLMDKDFVTESVISFTADRTPYKTFPFELYPHTH